MSGYKLKKIGICLLGSLILAGILGMACDMTLAWRGKSVPCSLFLIGILILTIPIYGIFRKKPKNALKAAAWVLAVLCVMGAASFLTWRQFSKDAVFESLDRGKEQLYAGQKVMLIVPHEDDEINVLGGVMEEYVRYGSELYVVFVTNGDAEGLAQERIQEALAVLEQIGVGEAHGIFLGYGDTWQEGGPHLYNAQPGVTLESYSGHTATYGSADHAPYREGRSYTIDHLLEDLQSVILEHKPGVIYCCDYDYHIDHRATSLAFEKVMGRILQSYPDYRPLVFKGYAYSTAWYAQPDFYATNLRSTQNVFASPYNQQPGVYRWEERLRLPVWDGSLSRSLLSAKAYETLSLHRSQQAGFQAARVINGDKVVWYRDTHSLCYQADIQVSSGNGELLNDFMLLEHSNLVDTDRLPTDGTWIPQDGEKWAAVTFSQPQDVALIRLYDNPSPQDNVLAGVIRFSDGSEAAFGPLDPQGAATTIQIDKTGITGFTIYLRQTEGERAGLTEVEAFSEPPEHGLRYVKLMDTEGNFAYDYWISETSRDYLAVYTQGLTAQERENLTLSWDNQQCWGAFENGALRVICPEGKTMKLTVTLPGTDVSDTIRIRNPGKPIRLWYAFSQMLEEQVFEKYCEGTYRNSATYKLLATLLG